MDEIGNLEDVLQVVHVCLASSIRSLEDVSCRRLLVGGLGGTDRGGVRAPLRQGAGLGALASGRTGGVQDHHRAGN